MNSRAIAAPTGRFVSLYRLLPLVLLASVVAAPGSVGAASVAAAGRSVEADFNGDGRSDLAVAAPFEDVSGIAEAGAVNVIYGSSNRLSSMGNQLWHQNKSAVLDAAEYRDHFGSSLASGDFNGDGFHDLAIGVPTENLGGLPDVGGVNVIYGSSGGLSSAGNQFVRQSSSGQGDAVAERYDYFGFSLASGDHNADAFDDLAVGAPMEAIGSVGRAGAVGVMHGSSAGLAQTPDELWNENSPGIDEDAEYYELYGRALATEDYNGDGFSDLAIGIVHEEVSGLMWAGAVNVIYGSSNGLHPEGSQFWTQDSPGIEEVAEADDHFGRPLAASDFNGDSFADLAVTARRESVGDVAKAGAVNVIYGSSRGLSAIGNQVWHQDTAGIAENADADELFGRALATGDFDADGYADLAAGIPNESVGTNSGAGAIGVIYGSSGGLSAAGNQLWSQNTFGIEETAEAGDALGRALGAADFDGDAFADLAAGIPYEDIGGVADAGGASVLYGASVGLAASGDQLWHQNTLGILDASETADGFGSAVANANRSDVWISGT